MQERRGATERGEPEPYAVIELVRGPNWAPGVSARLIGVQLRHMRTLWRLRQQRLVLVAGPVSGKEPVRGLIVVRQRDTEATLAALNEDDAIRLGRLVPRVAAPHDLPRN